MPEVVESRHLGSDRNARVSSVPKESAHFDPKCDDDFSVGLKAGGKVDANTSIATKKADAVPQKAANLSQLAMITPGAMLCLQLYRLESH